MSEHCRCGAPPPGPHHPSCSGFAACTCQIHNAPVPQFSSPEREVLEAHAAAPIMVTGADARVVIVTTGEKPRWMPGFIWNRLVRAVVKSVRVEVEIQGKKE